MRARLASTTLTTAKTVGPLAAGVRSRHWPKGDRMSRIRKAREMRDEGFTLIELLIVIVVLGILAGIVVFGLGTFKSESKLGACKADVKQYQTAVDAYMALPSNPTNTVPTITDLTGGNFLKTTAPTDEAIAIAPADGTVTGTYDPGGGAALVDCV
jgi:prepilin-type N-terminal cleavage/methylation domain-containing protein